MGQRLSCSEADAVTSRKIAEQAGRDGDAKNDARAAEREAEEKEAEQWKAQAQTETVEEQLLVDQLAQLYKFKILLLGAGESGKSQCIVSFIIFLFFWWLLPINMYRRFC